MAVQSQIPRIQPAAASPTPSTRSTPSPEPKAMPKSKISSCPQTPSTRSTPSPEPRAAIPKSKIPSRPQTPSSGRQTRSGWRPSGHWIPPGAVDGRSPSLSPSSASSASTSRLPRLIPWLTRKSLASQTSISKASSSASSSSKDSATSSESSKKDSLTSKRDWKETWWGDSGAPLLALMHQQNPTVDRSPATVGEPDASKRFIMLLNPYGRPIGPESQDPPVARMVYPKQVDWFERDDIGGLNKWRMAVFEHYLGPSATIGEVEWHPLEDEFVLREYGKLVREAREMECVIGVGRELPSWARITRDFNRRFEGRKLEGAGARLRSEVTREMLRKRYIELVKCGAFFTGDGRSIERGDSSDNSSTR